MTDKQIALRIFLTGLVLLLGASPLLVSCASPELIVTQGSSICTAPTLAECERLSKIGEALHSPEMERAIAEARK